MPIAECLDGKAVDWMEQEGSEHSSTG